jgi:hypothetical protein
VLAAGAAGATLAGTTSAFSPADANGAAGEKVFRQGGRFIKVCSRNVTSLAEFGPGSAG